MDYRVSKNFNTVKRDTTQGNSQHYRVRDKKGFTLVEVLTSVAIFSILTGGAVGFLVSGLKSQAKFLTTREIVDNSSHAVEYMSRLLRMAKKDKEGNCITENVNYETSGEGTIIKFLDFKDRCKEFTLLNNQIIVEENGGGALALTSDNLTVDFLKFEVKGGGQEDDIQPRVTMLFEIKGKNAQDSTGARIQTTISQRNLDIRY